jgi:hypothetical protein
MENRFFRWRGIDASPTQIVPKDLIPQLPATDSRYFVGILRHLDLLLPDAGLTFFLTWNLDAYHEAMENAVVLLVGDEQNQAPKYRHRVRVIFKTGGVRRSPLGETMRLPVSIAWRVLLRDARDRAVKVQRGFRKGSSGGAVTPMYEIPFGPFALMEYDPPPVEQRPMDVFFAGGAITSWTLRAKFVARRQMAAAMAAARAALPQMRTAEMGGAASSGKWLGPEAYTQSLANAKIALAPRGNCDAETYRIFEAAKLGCVIISEPLPSRWYYRGCPAISIPHWSALPGVLRELLNDPARLQQLSLRAREWWDTMICEEAVAKFIAQTMAGNGAAPMGREI